jgi:hypothetical protein
LALDNALEILEVVDRIARMEREFGPEIYSSDAWRRGWIGDVRPSLERLAEFHQRGMIDGGNARAGIEPPEPGQLPPKAGSRN